MTFKISSLLYLTLFSMLVWPPYIGMRLNLIFIQPFKLLLLAFLVISSINYLVRPSYFLSQIRELFKSPIGKWAICFLAFSAVATIANGIDSNSIKFISNSVILLLLCMFGGFYFEECEHNCLPLIVLAVIGGLLGLFGVLEFIAQSNFLKQFAVISKDKADIAFMLVAASDKTRGSYRSQATFVHPLVLAQFLIIAIPFIYLRCKQAPNTKMRIFNYCLLVSAVAGLYCTGSRAAFSVLLIFIILYILAGARSIFSAANRGIRLVLPIFASIFLVIVILLFINNVETKLKGSSKIETSSTIARLIMLDNTIDAVRDRPIWGWGPGTAATIAGIDNDSGGTIDSFYMTTSVERGLPALLLLIILQLNVIWYGYKRWVNAKDKERFFIGVNTIALSGYFLISSILSIDYLMPLAFYLIGLQAKSSIDSIKSSILPS